MSFLQPTPAKSTSSSSSNSSNVNNPLITSAYGGQINQGTGANNYLSSLLTGTGNTGAANAGYQSYLDNAGYAPAMRQLSQSITGQGAASGLLRSGATDIALQKRGTELNQSFFNNYLQQLAGLSGLGLQAGGIVANTGQQSQSQSQSKNTGGSPSVAGTVASVAGSLIPLFSDRRLKRDIELVGREADGLGIYLCRYVWSRTRKLMVMADEIAKLRPWALGPKIGGFSTVIYGAL